MATTVRVGSSTLTVPDSVVAAVPSPQLRRKTVAVGIRPEHLSAAADGARDTINGLIDVREGLGSGVILHMTTDAVGVDPAAAENDAETPSGVVVPAEPHTTAQVGERAVLGVDTRQLHLLTSIPAVAQIDELTLAGHRRVRPTVLTVARGRWRISRRGARRANAPGLDERGRPDACRERTGQDLRAAAPRRLERLGPWSSRCMRRGGSS